MPRRHAVPLFNTIDYPLPAGLGHREDLTQCRGCAPSLDATGFIGLNILIARFLDKTIQLRAVSGQCCVVGQLVKTELAGSHVMQVMVGTHAMKLFSLAPRI
jgi:hypothetical protein